MSGELSLTERAQYLLKVLVEHHIRDGKPVASTTLSRSSGLKVSAATVRNTMSDLEGMGLIQSPHTSAGRVPTQKGYRLFVDNLVAVRPMEQIDLSLIQQEISGTAKNTHEVLSSASLLLSQITSMASVVMVPRHSRVILRHMEFLPLSEGRVLAILVTNRDEVQNRIIQTDRHFDESELRQAANWFNQTFEGEELSLVRGRLVTELERSKTEMDESMHNIVQMAQQAVTPRESEQDQVMVSGRSKLMDYEEFNEMDRLRQLFNAFSEKHDMIHLLDQCMEADGVQVFIGEESGYSFFDDCSVVTAPYSHGDEVMGVLGVVGPTRMAYDRVIPVVDMTAKILGSALKLMD
ncbi:MAG: heat-inducible transcription repressor HrcA [Gammaproteobacteria bacterium]|jgi:heat-inducible transcriptional repressor|nr:heat-inducible transcription repressor HrcA [Gammaproteobacteria bacterium]MBT3490411.1 heat-inducible transcription repressor HrcA [Gammaproteobacteria bacterium]MBT3718123.1 heat-inducible transcription repressor HrcA [Gammaproteobacteria bacterium]MBT3845563.1 heat-inducible transcription repressor HrcA [Gammaproteobacteria bacterium]MBT3893301.1 heat-inducible transcription repressor HrcA [Gammaproteobacteria bacterium]